MKNRVSPPTTAGKLTNRRSPRPLLRSYILTCLVFLIGTLAFTATPALATNGYEKVTSTFGSEGSGPGQFKEPTSIAVNDETGDVYVLDSGNDRVEWLNSTGSEFKGEFNGTGSPTGKFLEPEGIAVDNSCMSQTPTLTGTECETFDPSIGDVYVADAGHGVVDKFSATGKYEGQLLGRCENAAEVPPCAASKLVPFVGQLNVAVDSSGNVFVYEGSTQPEPGARELYEFDGAGGFVEPIRVLAIGAPMAVPGFAVDSSDDLYVTGGGQLAFEYVKGTGQLDQITEHANPQATLALISSSSDLLVDEGSSIELFKAPILQGSPFLTFPSEGLAESEGIAVNGAKGEGTVYATQRGKDDVDVFESGPAKAPVVVPGSESALTVGPETAESRFAAVIDPGNRTTTYFFQYAHSEEELLNGEGEQVAGEAPIPAEFGGVTVASPTVDLRAQRTTYYRVVAENELGQAKGEVQVYTKLPLVAGENTSDLTSTSVMLETTINPVLNETGYAFDYAASKEQLEKGEGIVVHGTTGFLQQQKLSELQKLEEVLTKEEEQRAKEGLPSLGRVPICPGIVEEGGTGHLGAVNKPCPVSAEIFGLIPGQRYYYRVVVENPVTENPNNVNEGKPITGKIEEFTPYGPPAVVTGAAQSITGTAATLSGSVNPERTEAKYYFAYISETGYQEALGNHAANPASPHYQEELAKGSVSPYAEGETTATFNLAASGSPQAVGPIPADGLLPGEIYHYALIATNKFELQTVGPDQTFTTGSASPPAVSTGAASAVSQNSATLSGTVTTNGLQTNYGFEIGTEPFQPGAHLPPTGLGAIGGAQTEEVHVTLGELAPGTTYYYRVTATNADGTEKGQPESFTTPGFPSLLSTPVGGVLIPYTSPGFPKEEKGGTVTSTKKLTNKQKLQKALKQCKKDKSKSRRVKCEKQAHAKYPVGKAKKKGKK